VHGVAQTQSALYDGIDLELSWSEQALPERERTKHVNRLHPYLGKFIPQLVETLLQRYVPKGGRVLDPFAGSGTTLVQALESGHDATGVDIAAFNALLMRVKTERYNLFTLEHEIREACARLDGLGSKRVGRGTPAYVRRWFAPESAAQLLDFRSWIPDYEHADVLRVVLARAARSARLTTHFDLDFPRTPQTEPYWCYKHKRECRPVQRADHFLRRYALDTLARVHAFARVRARGRAASVLHGDARELELGGPYAAVITSPPYPGLIDYHEQHRYAYELLGLDDLRERELGAAARGTSRAAVETYVAGVSDVLRRCAESLRPGAPVLVVVNDRRGLYPEILERSGLRLADRLERHVNRRTGRRSGEYFESILVATR
jgi:DNA modification methylase